MQQASILWHVSLLAPPGQKGMALGIVGLVRAAGHRVLMVAGVAADAFDRRRLMMVTQIGGFVVAGVLSIFAFVGCSRCGRSTCSRRLVLRSARSIRPLAIRWSRRSSRASTCPARST